MEQSFIFILFFKLPAVKYISVLKEKVFVPLFVCAYMKKLPTV